jgi:hypothetical protein
MVMRVNAHSTQAAATSRWMWHTGDVGRHVLWIEDGGIGVVGNRRPLDALSIAGQYRPVGRVVRQCQRQHVCGSALSGVVHWQDRVRWKLLLWQIRIDRQECRITPFGDLSRIDACQNLSPCNSVSATSHSLTHSLTHSLSLSLTHSLTHSLIDLIDHIHPK